METFRTARFRKRTHRNQDLGPFINHEMNRCIACYRCVRFYRGIAGGRDLHVFLQAYQRTATTPQPLVAFVAFYQGDVKVFETPPAAITEPFAGRSKAVPVRLSFPLEDLAPGRYDCQVTVLDPTSQKASFWRAPIVVLP